MEREIYFVDVDELDEGVRRWTVGEGGRLFTEEDGDTHWTLRTNAATGGEFLDLYEGSHGLDRGDRDARLGLETLDDSVGSEWFSFSREKAEAFLVEQRAVVARKLAEKVEARRVLEAKICEVVSQVTGIELTPGQQAELIRVLGPFLTK